MRKTHSAEVCTAEMGYEQATSTTTAIHILEITINVIQQWPSPSPLVPILSKTNDANLSTTLEMYKCRRNSTLDSHLGGYPWAMANQSGGFRLVTISGSLHTLDCPLPAANKLPFSPAF